MENCTNCSVNDSNLAGPGFGAFLIVILLLVTTAIVLNVTIITALCAAHSVSKLIRIFLINLLVAGVLLGLTGIAFSLSGLFLNFTSLPPPDLKFCRFLLWGYGIAVTARMYCLAGFSIIVLLIVRYNKKEMKTLYIVLFLALIWCVSILLNTHILVPPIYAVQYYDGVACFPRTFDADIIKEVRYVFTAVWVIFGGLIPMTISIAIPIVLLCYIRGKTMTGSSYRNGIAKFTLFLVAGNLINLVGQAVVALLVYISEPPGVYLSYLIGFISLIPTPIMILIFLKPVRTEVTRGICCARNLLNLLHMSRISFSLDKSRSTAADALLI